MISKGDHIAYRYEIHEVIGKGSFGIVVKAFDWKDNTYIAIKILKRSSSKLKLKEMEVLEQISQVEKNSKNMIKYYGSLKFRGHICLKFELLSISLRE
jgi:dual specificity tyrosine-phosphorylation-regulated kinase 2/3/4